MRLFLSELFRDRVFGSTLLKIAIPIILQNLVCSSLNMVDTIMIGRIGTVELAAVGVATQFFFFNMVVLVGICSGYCIFVAQYWGKHNLIKIKHYLGVILCYATFAGIIFTTLGILYPEEIMNLFNHDPEVITIGATYIRILAVTTIFQGFTIGYGYASRSIENAFLPMIASLIALATNTFLNYVLIFGKFGAPAMGVTGAALATLFARFLEMMLLLIYTYGKKTPLAVHLSEMNLHPSFFFGDLKTVLPVMLNEVCWGLATVVYIAAYGRIDTDALASVQVAFTVQNLFLIFGFGVSGATATMVGNNIGRGLTKRATLYAHRSLFLALAIGTVLTVMILILAPVFLYFYDLSSERVTEDALLMIRILALTMPMKLINMTLIMGILRAGGDVIFSLLSESCTMWLIGVPLAFFGALVLKWPVYMVFTLVIAEEIVKLILCLWRVFSNRWLRLCL